MKVRSSEAGRRPQPLRELEFEGEPLPPATWHLLPAGLAMPREAVDRRLEQLARLHALDDSQGTLMEESDNEC